MKIIDLFLSSDKYLSVPLLISLTTIVLIFATTAALYNNLPSRLPLFYSLPWGQSQLVDKQQFFILPAVLLLTVLINTFVSLHLHPAQTALKRILMLNLIVLSVVSLVTAFKIVSIFI